MNLSSTCVGARQGFIVILQCKGVHAKLHDGFDEDAWPSTGIPCKG